MPDQMHTYDNPPSSCREVDSHILCHQTLDAVNLLSHGFFATNPEIAHDLGRGEILIQDWQHEILGLICRLIFLKSTTDRGLLHPPESDTDARHHYVDSYTVEALSTISRHGFAPSKLSIQYESLKGVFYRLSAGDSELALPGWGGLFSHELFSRLMAAKLPDKVLMEASRSLFWQTDEAGEFPLDWMSLNIGLVLAPLLELDCQMGPDGPVFFFPANVRTVPTPTDLVEALVDVCLAPLLDRAVAEADDPTKALLQLLIIDPACGSGQFLLAAARRIATRLARIRAKGTPSTEDFRHALRDVARFCIHGVDRNPMAVELTKFALWIETVDPGLPLVFLDAQIRCGDALLGVFDLKVLEAGIPDAAYNPLTGDVRATAAHYRHKNWKNKDDGHQSDLFAMQAWMPKYQLAVGRFEAMRAMPESTIDQIHAKAECLAALKQEEVRSIQNACDLYVAAFLMPKTESGSTLSVPNNKELWLALNQGIIRPEMEDALLAASHARAFHWPLGFPDIMHRGGFDVVLGSPPWGKMDVDEAGFLAMRGFQDLPGLADRRERQRRLQLLAEGRLRQQLTEAPPDLNPDPFEVKVYQELVSEQRRVDAVRNFVRAPENEGGRFPVTQPAFRGAYAYFAELSVQLSRSHGALILPSEFISSHQVSSLLHSLLDEQQIARVADFSNREGLFEDLSPTAKISLFAWASQKAEAQFSFSLTEPGQLAEVERSFPLSSASISLYKPNSNTPPAFRSQADATLASKICARIPAIVKGDAGNPWKLSLRQVGFHPIFDQPHLNNAAHLVANGYRRQGSLWLNHGETCVPLLSGSMIHSFDHRFSSQSADQDRHNRAQLVTTIPQHADPNFETEPSWWVRKEELDARLSQHTNKEWLIGWRELSSSENERTLIFAILPRLGVADGVGLLFPNASTAAICGLYASLNSLVTDYLARGCQTGFRIGTRNVADVHVPGPTFYTAPRLDFIVPRVLELTYTSHSLAPFARDLGYDGSPYVWDEDRRALLRAELDAFYARAYGLDRDDLRYILDPADVKGPDYPSETFRVLKQKEIRHHGEYRTRCLVLEAWDRMMEDGTFASLTLSSN